MVMTAAERSECIPAEGWVMPPSAMKLRALKRSCIHYYSGQVQPLQLISFLNGLLPVLINKLTKHPETRGKT